jgi:hypothetical protein
VLNKGDNLENKLIKEQRTVINLLPQNQTKYNKMLMRLSFSEPKRKKNCQHETREKSKDHEFYSLKIQKKKPAVDNTRIITRYHFIKIQVMKRRQMSTDSILGETN